MSYLTKLLMALALALVVGVTLVMLLATTVQSATIAGLVVGVIAFFLWGMISMLAGNEINATLSLVVTAVVEYVALTLLPTLGPLALLIALLAGTFVYWYVFPRFLQSNPNGLQKSRTS